MLSKPWLELGLDTEKEDRKNSEMNSLVKTRQHL